MPSVIEVLEIPEGTEGGASIDSGASFTRSYSVEFDGINKSPFAAITATDGVITIPAYGAAHPDLSSSLVVDKTAKTDADSNGWIWLVTVKYAYPKVDADPQGSPDPPGQDGGDPGESAPPATPLPSKKITWGSWTKTSAPQKDIVGNALLNSAFDCFDPPLTREDEHIQVTIVRTQSSFDAFWFNYLNNSLNNQAFAMKGYEFAAKTLRCKIQAEYPTGPNNNLWQITITIQHDPATWDWRVLNAGYNYWDSIKAIPIFIKGHRPSVPQLLTADGLKLAKNGTPTYKDFRKYYVADFAYLGLDF